MPANIKNMLEKNGLVKLTEECGELIQIAAKKQTCMDTDVHWDGQGSLKERIENEIADVMAAAEIVIKNFELDKHKIIARSNQKFNLFREWMGQENQTEIKINNIFCDIQTGRKFRVTKLNIKNVQENPQNYEFICENPHDDGDFSYLCAGSFCRCQQ